MTVEEIINIAKISQFLAANDIAKSGLHVGGGAYLNLPRQLYMERKTVERLYDLDPNDATLTKTANWVLALCGKYRFKAQSITGSGGAIAPVTPGGGGASVEALDFEVSASSIMPTGATTLTIDGTGGTPDYRGYKIVNFSKNGIWQNTTSLGDGSSYYAWNSVTGLFSCFPALTVGELIRITPDAVGGTASSSSVNTPDTIILSSDGTYTLDSGYQIWKITINPSAADTIRIGTTANGEEIMMDKLVTINTYAGNGVTADVFAESGDVTIYFTGFSAAATINIYTLPI